MAQDKPPVPIRSKRDKIARLRKRLAEVVRTREQDVRLVDVIKGVLDLLDDEL